MLALIYKFKVKSDKEAEFKKNWALIAAENKELHGSDGSCLHKGQDGFWYAYARWPSVEVWNADREFENKLAQADFNACIQERYNAIPMEVTTDLLSGPDKSD